MKQQIAKAKYVHIAPRKVRLIANTLKGLNVNEAEAQLMLRPQRSSDPLLKLVRSAVANAKNNQKMGAEGLIISKITVDEGPIMKRMLPRAQGRATPIHKKMSHITLVLEEKSGSEPRFNIIPPQKKGKKDAPKAKKPKAVKTHEEAVQDSKPKAQKTDKGLLKKIFRRKSV
ncbi:MAG: 50S ribosomal protein L22 [Candidatus Harrisonbacteria bacterium CG10_big_fil_rev_8_21_14_0_10_40_38]|uniref:Large ribosomal subunit protein uL22 n=1 Tax=Candidatus Harrisonbacteria bacterium CG10_big_fil_rev_8_21_14_0_10_40_38 TaxID=1974583 RepID=A0A2H0UUL8_9BACT|nr:MAG: 50S ribosomal protein L22 [Candidatus Harrisonbacteria bacterium CG10_big_fil_rev_8_21_14_0_10_40_38]